MIDTRSRKSVRQKLRPAQARPTVREDAHSAVKEIHGYRLICKVGQGGMGAVFKAQQTSLDREVALKILPPKIAADDNFIERFRNEARASAKLCHPNVVQGIDVGHDERTGLWYFAMEFIDGPSVKKLIEKQGVVEEPESLRIIGEVARALAAINHAGMVHRDIKPDNILLTSAGEVKVADLGLTRDLMNDADMTTAGQAVGTPHYMSPEQVRGIKDVDIRADLYALGATLYHMLAGQHPYDGESSFDIMSKHLNAPPPLVREVNASVSEDCERLIVKLMAKKREERIQTPEKVIQEIDALLNPVIPVIPETVEPVRKHPSRARTPIVLQASRASIPALSRTALKSASPARGSPQWCVYVAVAVPLLVLGVALAMSGGSSAAAGTRSEPLQSTPSTDLPVASTAPVAVQRPPPAIPARHAEYALTSLAPVSTTTPISTTGADSSSTANASVWWEAEDAVQNDFVSHCWLGEQLDKSNLSGRKYLNHMNDANWLKFQHRNLAASVHATFNVDIPADATYTLWVREYDPWSAAPWTFHWDNESWFSVPSSYPFENKVEIGKDRWMVWRKYPAQTLSKGRHTFKLEADFTSQKTIAAYDCFYLTTNQFKPSGAARP